MSVPSEDMLFEKVPAEMVMTTPTCLLHSVNQSGITDLTTWQTPDLCCFKESNQTVKPVFKNDSFQLSV